MPVRLHWKKREVWGIARRHGPMVPSRFSTCPASIPMAKGQPPAAPVPPSLLPSPKPWPNPRPGGEAWKPGLWSRQETDGPGWDGAARWAPPALSDLTRSAWRKPHELAGGWSGTRSGSRWTSLPPAKIDTPVSAGWRTISCLLSNSTQGAENPAPKRSALPMTLFSPDMPAGEKAGPSPAIQSVIQ